MQLTSLFFLSALRTSCLRPSSFCNVDSIKQELNNNECISKPQMHSNECLECKRTENNTHFFFFFPQHSWNLGFCWPYVCQLIVQFTKLGHGKFPCTMCFFQFFLLSGDFFICLLENLQLIRVQCIMRNCLHPWFQLASLPLYRYIHVCVVV